MKKCLFLFAIALSFNVLIANPVDVNEAKALGQKFVDANFEMSHRGIALASAYTAYTDRGNACFYVFNVGDAGFIIISADDFYRPVIGYSENGRFDYDNMPPALRDYLDGITMERGMNRSTSSAAPDVAADWRMLEKTGRLVSRHGGRGVDYLVQTQWNQDYPYNYYCPEDPDGSHGHTYVGCLATAMAQLVAFWKYPEHGNGSHCYIHEDYGQICADFENTYYDWDHIANKIDENSPIEEIEAVALVSFHCGVMIDMGYGPDGSGGGSGGIPDALNTYYNYSDANVQYSRNDFETAIWKSMVREQFDMGWPMYYGGCEDDGCHAFVCDGYDDYDMFHFNLGWGGGSDGWYLIDEAPYTHPADAMFNFVPQVVYDAAPSAPTNLMVTPNSDTSFEATLTWTNPTTYLDGSAMTDIEKIVVMRNSKVCHEITSGIVAGQQMTITDRVPYYDSFEYEVYAVSNGRNGKQAIKRLVSFGPTCDWRVVMTTTDFHGWKGNHISVYNMANTEIANMTMTSSTPTAEHFDAPVGRVKFAWTPSNDTIDNISFTIRDSQDAIVYQFSGSTAEMNAGVFFTANNGCGNTGVCGAPTALEGVAEDNDIALNWNGSLDDAYAYCIYRDDAIYQMITENTTFIDQETGGLGHCYNVSVLCHNGESEWSDMTCVSVGDACNPARNVWYDTQNNGKPIITWDSPEHNEALSGYFIYRKCDDGEYQRIKAVNADKNEYKETTQLTDGHWYSYKVIAYYRDIDCYSIPAKARYGNEYFVKYYYSTDGVDEDYADNVEIYPNPAKDLLTIKAENLNEVVIYNSIGQKVYEQKLSTDEVLINTSDFNAGIYMVRVIVGGNEITRKVSVLF